MRKTIFTLLAVGCTLQSSAQQTVDDVLRMVERNNTTLQALQHTAEAQRLENRDGLALPDPDIEFSYLWGGPSAIGKRKDVSVAQGFDIATLTGLKGKVAREKDVLVEWQYKTDRIAVLLEAKQCCIDLIYYNAQIGQLDVRLSNAREIADGQMKRLHSGEGNRLEYNNVMLNISVIEGESIRMRTERDALLAQLTGLCGGETVDFTVTEFERVDMPVDFTVWYRTVETDNPSLACVRQETEVSRRQLTLDKTMGLPSFSLGYMGEFTAGERYQGITLGMSVPLWSNKNRVRQSRAALRAAESRQDDAARTAYRNMETQFRRTAGLKAVAETCRTSLEKADNRQLLKTALDEGEISVLDYLTGMGLYYDAASKALDAERAYQKAFAELTATSL